MWEGLSSLLCSTGVLPLALMPFTVFGQEWSGSLEANCSDGGYDTEAEPSHWEQLHLPIEVPPSLKALSQVPVLPRLRHQWGGVGKGTGSLHRLPQEKWQCKHILLMLLFKDEMRISAE